MVTQCGGFRCSPASTHFGSGLARLLLLGLQICERSLTATTGGPIGPPTPNFARAEMLPSGYLIRPCEGGGSMVHIVDHVDLDVSLSHHD